MDSPRSNLIERGAKHPAWKGHGEISGFMWAKIRESARRRSIELTITIEEAWAVFQEQNGRCALSNVELLFSRTSRENTASLDRIDSNLGYTKTNVQWVHKTVNKMKNDLGNNEFLLWCSMIKSNILQG